MKKHEKVTKSKLGVFLMSLAPVVRYNSHHPPIMDFLLRLLLAVNTALNLVAGNNTFAGAVSFLVPDWNKLPSSLRNRPCFIWILILELRRTFNFLTPTRMYVLAPNTSFIYLRRYFLREPRSSFRFILLPLSLVTAAGSESMAAS